MNKEFTIKEEIIEKKLKMLKSLLNHHEEKVEYYENRVDEEFNKLEKLYNK